MLQSLGGKVTLEKQKFIFSVLLSMLLSISLQCKNSSMIESTTSEIRLPGVESWLYYWSSVSLRGSYWIAVTVLYKIKIEDIFVSYSLFSSSSFLFHLSFFSSSLSFFFLPSITHHFFWGIQVFPSWRPKRPDVLPTPTLLVRAAARDLVPANSSSCWDFASGGGSAHM